MKAIISMDQGPVLGLAIATFDTKKPVESMVMSPSSGISERPELGQ